MLIHIVLTIIIVSVLGLAFAVTSHKLGRGDKRPGCGRGECSSCNPANRDTECPSEITPIVSSSRRAADDSIDDEDPSMTYAESPDRLRRIDDPIDEEDPDNE